MRDRAELAELRDRFLSFRLERALTRLRSPLGFLNSGAHPDDEHSALLAWLRFDRGLWTATLSATRGQGGQNRIGPERGDLLGAIRSREMEHAATVLDADHYWLDEGPAKEPREPLTDFGFSKSGRDTLHRWGGRAAVVARMVRIYRLHRPDIVLPTFLDVPGQHGHHRAMTEAALAALPLAADPAFACDGLPVWQVARACLPAWSGGGATYDDEVPPPPATLILRPQGPEPWTGASWAEIGEASRLCHASQDMGDPTRCQDEGWPLHLIGGGAGDDLLQGLPQTYGALEGAPPQLAEMDAIFAELSGRNSHDPDGQGLRGQWLPQALRAADILLAEARSSGCCSGGNSGVHEFRLARLKRGLDQAMLLAADLLPVSLPRAFSPAPPFHPLWDRISGNGSSHRLICHEIDDRPYQGFVPFAPDMGGDRGPEGPDLLDLIHRRGEGPGRWSLPLPHGWVPKLPSELPAELLPGPGLNGAVLQVDKDLAAGLYQLAILDQGRPVLRQRSGRLASGEVVFVQEPLTLRLLSLQLTPPEGRIGYIAGSEEMTAALQAMGIAPLFLPNPITPEALEGIDTLLLGVVALGMRPDVLAILPHLADWVRRGGNLVTFYQRPDQGWPQEGIGLDLLRIGQPSLRWRVTDPEAVVRVLAPAHPLLMGPNLIGEGDWRGWNKERGLYFAASWGAGYQPLLAMSDPDEQPLHGALLSGLFGAGRHSHVSLTLHHQIAHMVPGAIRLLANLLHAPRTVP
ncbi:PIG-L family deacetylase [Pseudogemmobacter hezensis]|uniref:PIG-L family deacetylase n=1 Tax=Pseudogemmobacter hezensis TaxID=2737662 RepID=UPI001C130E52|nr:PIG-L family deacetylase [Pseudogemmobacter hezensis]